MDVRWLKITDEIQQATQIINTLDKAKFERFVNHIKDNSTTKPRNEIFTADEIGTVEKAFKLTRDQVTLLIKVSLHILERMSKFVMRPSNFLADFQGKLRMDKDKATVFIEAWRTIMKDIFEDYRLKNFNQVQEATDVKWALNVAVGSHLNKKEKLASVMFDIKTEGEDASAADKTFFELTAPELQALHAQLENAQLELDSILSYYLV